MIEPDITAIRYLRDVEAGGPGTFRNHNHNRILEQMAETTLSDLAC